MMVAILDISLYLVRRDQPLRQATLLERLTYEGLTLMSVMTKTVREYTPFYVSVTLGSKLMSCHMLSILSLTSQL